jgi:hypothetical protein
MNGPWTKYQTAAPVVPSATDGPWAKYGAPKVDPATMQPAGVPEFVPPGVEGYNPKTGEVAPSTLSDVIDSGASGIRQGVESSLGAFGDVGKYQDKIAQWAAEKLGASPETQATAGNIASKLTPFVMAPTTSTIQDTTNKAIGHPYQPQTTAGEYAHTVGEFVPAALIPSGEASLPQRLITQALLPGVGSEAAGQAAQKYMPSAEPYARVAGALAGGSLPSVASHIISPFPNTPERERLAQTLMDEGVDVTAGQRTGRNALRYAESELGGGAAANMMDRQGEQFTAAALRRAGVDAPRATPEVIDGAFTRIGQQFDDLAARNTLIPDHQMIGDLRNTVNEYGNLVPESARAPIVENLTNDIVDMIRRNGQIPGDSYQSLTSRIAKAARTTKDPELGMALRGMRESLDGAMERSIQASNPADVGAWQDARNQYRNLLVIEKAATGAGENAASGLISPSALRNATVQQSRRAYARGEGDFADLARAGEGVMKPLPNSGTASRTAVRGAFSTLGGIAGAASGGGLTGGGIGAVAGAILPPLAGRALLSGPGRAYLGNQLATGLQPASNPRIAAIVAALLNRPDTARLAPPAN